MCNMGPAGVAMCSGETTSATVFVHRAIEFFTRDHDGLARPYLETSALIIADRGPGIQSGNMIAAQSNSASAYGGKEYSPIVVRARFGCCLFYCRRRIFRIPDLFMVSTGMVHFSSSGPSQTRSCGSCCLVLCVRSCILVCSALSHTRLYVLRTQVLSYRKKCNRARTQCYDLYVAIRNWTFRLRAVELRAQWNTEWACMLDLVSRAESACLWDKQATLDMRVWLDSLKCNRAKWCAAFQEGRWGTGFVYTSNMSEAEHA